MSSGDVRGLNPRALAACPDRVLSSMGRRGPRWSGRNHLAANCTANRKSRQSGFLEITLFTLLRRFESTKKNIKLYSDLARLLCEYVVFDAVKVSGLAAKTRQHVSWILKCFNREQILR